MNCSVVTRNGLFSGTVQQVAQNIAYATDKLVDDIELDIWIGLAHTDLPLILRDVPIMGDVQTDKSGYDAFS